MRYILVLLVMCAASAAQIADHQAYGLHASTFWCSLLLLNCPVARIKLSMLIEQLLASICNSNKAIQKYCLGGEHLRRASMVTRQAARRLALRLSAALRANAWKSEAGTAGTF